MITSNLKNKIIVTVKENINKFSYKVDGVAKEKEPSKKLDFTRFSTLSTEFSIGCGGFLRGVWKTVVEKR